IISRSIAFLYVFPRQRFEACPGLGDKRAIGVLGEEACIEIRTVGSVCFVPGYRVRRPRALGGIDHRTRCEESHEPQEPDEGPDRYTWPHSLPSLEKNLPQRGLQALHRQKIHRHGLLMTTRPPSLRPGP